MVSYNEAGMQLVITIKTAEPSEFRDWLLNGLSAAVRWNAAANGGKYDHDDTNLMVLAQLLEALVPVEKG